MDYHLERLLRVHAEPEHKNLYTWAINELDENGSVIGRDQIPWAWTLYFTAISCVLSDNIELEPEFQLKDKSPPAPIEITQRQIIRLELRPGHPRNDEDLFRKTTFSMFGTARTIERFLLEIHPILEADAQERCHAWGTPSYTSEIDFRDETEDDFIVFYLHVRPETFARYAAKIAHGAIDEITFGVGSVDGFFSDWSPAITTNSVKVLTSIEEQEVSDPTGTGVQPPRLGRVGKAALHINRRLEFTSGPVDVAGSHERNDGSPVSRQSRIESALETTTHQDISKLAASLRRASWLVVWLLAAILVALTFRR